MQNRAGIKKTQNAKRAFSLLAALLLALTPAAANGEELLSDSGYSLGEESADSSYIGDDHGNPDLAAPDDGAVDPESLYPEYTAADDYDENADQEIFTDPWMDPIDSEGSGEELLGDASVDNEGQTGTNAGEDAFSDSVLQEEGGLVLGDGGENGGPVLSDGEMLSQNEGIQEANQELQSFQESVVDSALDSPLKAENPDQLMAGTASSGEGWVQYADGWFWRKADGTILKEGGWVVLGGNRYFLANNSGRRKSGFITYDKKKYYLDPDTGILVTGFRKIGENTFYFDPAGSVPGAMATGIRKIDGNQYFFKSNGSMHTGWLSSNKKRYYYGKDGKALAGFQTIGGYIYYFDPAAFVMKTGWMVLDNNTYYFGTNGKMRRGYVTLSKKKYLFRQDGRMVKNEWIITKNRRYYFKPSGIRAAGMTAINGKYYYFHPTAGYMLKGWLTVKGNRYYFGTDGVRRTGVQKIGGKLYIFAGNGIMYRNRIAVKVQGRYYKVARNGVAVQYTKKVQIYALQKLNEVGWDLYKAYLWCAHEYQDCDDTVPSGYAPADWFALMGFENNGIGDCYVMAAMWYQMAKIMGVDVHFVMGKVPLARGGLGPHGWCEVDKDGATYIVDPDFESNTIRNQDRRNGYMITYGTPGTWQYTDGVRTN